MLILKSDLKELNYLDALVPLLLLQVKFKICLNARILTLNFPSLLAKEVEVLLASFP